MLDINIIKSDFPILNRMVNGHPLVYLDNAATTQKPLSVINSLVDYYTNYNSNIHRGVHTLSQEATEKYESARQKVKDFIKADFVEEIIFTKNDTESLNLVAYSYGLANLQAGDEVILSSAEHHSNIVPWQTVAKKTGAVLKFVKLKGFNFDYDDYYSLLSDKTKIVSLSQGSNVTGEIIDFSKITNVAHEKGAVVIADAGQTTSHYLVNLKDDLQDVDFITFSSHKIYGPTGVGVLYGKKVLLEKMEPMLGGGDMIKEVFEDYATWNDLPYKFEAGTPNIADIIAMGTAIDYLVSLNKEEVRNHEKDLTNYAIQKLSELDFVEIYHAEGENTLPIITFNVKGVHSHDVGTILDQKGIAIRTGHHCAQPLMKKMGQIATCRASMALYNTRED
ncbi:MAG: SufS family cysteine desulfurase, partial [bacterium]